MKSSRESDVSKGSFTSTLPPAHLHPSHPVLPFTRKWVGVSIASDTPCGMADIDISGLERNKQGEGNMSTAILAAMGHASVASLYSNKFCCKSAVC